MIPLCMVGHELVVPSAVEASRLAEFDAAARQVATVNEKDNTRLAFVQDWATWERFCDQEAIPPTTVSPSVLVMFAVWLAYTPVYPGAAPSTITRRITGVLAGWKQRGINAPRGITGEARKAVDDYSRHLAQQNITVGRGKAPALTVRDLRRISDALPDTLDGVRDRAILMVGFGTAARRSEMATLLVGDITEMPEGLSVVIRDSKTGRREPAVPMGTHDRTCPLRTWRAWLTESGITEGPAFRRIRHGTILSRLSGAAIGAIVTRAGQRAGLDIRLTGHSVRSGLATEARRAGHDTKSIAKQGGWVENSKVLYGYMEIVDRWTDNAVKGIGL